MSKQSFLEKKGIERREVEFGRSDFHPHDEYNIDMPDDPSNVRKSVKSHDEEGHPWGKQYGNGYVATIPHQTTSTAPSQQINTKDGGGSYDKFGNTPQIKDAGREYLQRISLYNKDNQYGKDSVVVDTSIDGQYFVK